ncbi:hypothetical protein [Kocuria sp. CH-021]|uniref:hypothetical protein n=1 Tax=Kocuria sp. CH-021 TaxID=3406735 RepID=UPI003C738F9C
MRHTTRIPWRTSGSAFLILLVAAACGASARSADDVARHLARGSSEVEEVSQAITRANGGSAQVERKTAEQLKTGAGVLSELMNAHNISAGEACDIYQLGSPFLGDDPQVEALLSRMRMDVERGVATKKSIDLACGIRGALDGI